MRFKATWVLLGVAAAAAAYFFLVEQPRHQQQQATSNSERRLTTLLAGDVREVNIERLDDTLAFHLTEDGWQMSAPVTDMLEDVMVNTLVRSLTGADVDRRLTDVQNRAEFGLDDPAAVITLIAGQRSLTVGIGDLTLTKSHCYGAVIDAGQQQAEVLILPAGIRRYGLRSLYEFRDKRIVRFEADAVQRFTIQSQRDTLSWFRAGSGLWLSVVGADTIPGDVNEVEAVLRELRGLRASEILPRDASGLGRMGTPVGKVTIEAAGQLPVVVTLGERHDNSSYIAVDGRDRIARVNASVLHLFEKSLSDLRDRRLVRFGMSVAATITIQSDEGVTSIVRAGEDWSYANPTLGTIDQEAVVAFITVLQNFRFREVLDRGLPVQARFDTTNAPFRLTVHAADGSIIDEFVAGDNLPAGNLRYAHSRGLDRWGIIDEEPLTDLMSRLDAFRIQ